MTRKTHCSHHNCVCRGGPLLISYSGGRKTKKEQQRGGGDKSVRRCKFFVKKALGLNMHIYFSIPC